MGNICIGPRRRAKTTSYHATSATTIDTKVASRLEPKDSSMHQVTTVSSETYSKLLAKVQRRDEAINALKAEVLEAKQAAKAEAAQNRQFLTWLEEREERIRAFEAFEQETPFDPHTAVSDAEQEKQRQLDALREQRIRAANEEGSIDIDAVDWDAKSEELQTGFGRWEQTEAEWKME